MTKIIGEAILNMPWQPRDPECKTAIWRDSRNPIITRDAVGTARSIFNSAAVPFQGKFAGVFRVDDTEWTMRLHAGFSEDGIHWQIEQSPLTLQGADPEMGDFQYGYDPRVCKIGEEYLVSWCNGYEDYPTIGLAKTRDFRTFEQLENAFLPFNRNGVLFPRKINGHYMMLSRPSDNAHTPFGDIFVSQSPDLLFWGKHRLVMRPAFGWQSVKIGAGPIPIETDEGWLVIYHGVRGCCNGYIYSFGAALLDLEKPWRVIARGRRYLLSPQTSYECVGDVPNVAFPCAALADSATGRIAIYYGCADTATGVCYSTVDEIIAQIKQQ